MQLRKILFVLAVSCGLLAMLGVSASQAVLPTKDSVYKGGLFAAGDNDPDRDGTIRFAIAKNEQKIAKFRAQHESVSSTGTQETTRQGIAISDEGTFHAEWFDGPKYTLDGRFVSKRRVKGTLTVVGVAEVTYTFDVRRN